MMISIPALCWLCQMPLAIPSWGICSRCTQQLPCLPPCCWQCGRPAHHPDQQPELPCGRCLQKPPAWQQLIAVSDYIPPLSPLIHRFKFRQQTILAAALGRLLLLSVLQARRSRLLPTAQLLLSVPLHKCHQWRRGYNHSALLAQWLGQKLNIDYVPQAIKRIRHTRTQHRLSARQRRRNVKNAFQLTVSVAQRHVALIDDVVTTGSTVQEIASLLISAGAASVQIWCLCRTL